MNLFFSAAIFFLRFGTSALEDNFIAEISTRYQNYILCIVLVRYGLHKIWSYYY